MVKKAILQYVKYFKVLLILFAIVLVAFIAIVGTGSKRITYYDSTNTQRVTTERVFDFGEQLTDAEEDKLRNLIAQKEKETCTDIVIVTLNMSLADYEPEYRDKYTMTITPDKYVMVFADKFWEDGKFGYDKPLVLDGTPNGGDGVLLVDNVYREADGKIHTWMCTTGKVETRFSSPMIDKCLDDFYEEVEYNYYQACVDFINSYVSEYKGENKIGTVPILIVVAIIVLIFVAKNSRKYVAKVTTNDRTYIIGKEPNFTTKQDVFLRKTVSKVYNPPSSSGGGGGGGHHSSGGGGSHGGGGHSR